VGGPAGIRTDNVAVDLALEAERRGGASDRCSTAPAEPTGD